MLFFKTMKEKIQQHEKMCFFHCLYGVSHSYACKSLRGLFELFCVLWETGTWWERETDRMHIPSQMNASKHAVWLGAGSSTRSWIFLTHGRFFCPSKTSTKDHVFKKGRDGSWTRRKVGNGIKQLISIMGKWGGGEEAKGPWGNTPKTCLFTYNKIKDSIPFFSLFGFIVLCLKLLLFSPHFIFKLAGCAMPMAGALCLLVSLSHFL